MAALPKRHPSTRRQGKRRASFKLKLASVSKCRYCGAKKTMHAVCPSCGKY